MGKTKDLRGPANPTWWLVPGNRQRFVRNLRKAQKKRQAAGLHVGRPKASEESNVSRAYEQLDSKKKVDKKKGCWLWTGLLWGSGYGRLQVQSVAGVTHGRVHVTAWLRWRGHVPAGKMICHACHVKRCFNPAHLYAGTNSQNQQDAVADGAFERYWTKTRRAALGKKMAGKGNPMYGVAGKDAPCYGRTGAKHPMFGKRQTEEAKAKISESLKKHYAKKN